MLMLSAINISIIFKLNHMIQLIDYIILYVCRQKGRES